MKSYFKCMKEIDAEELYNGLLAYGLFSEKLPPVFSSENYKEHCDTLNDNINSKKFLNGDYGYMIFDVIRNTNVPRTLGIPNPIGYYKLCKILEKNWEMIKEHFKKYTSDGKYKISRIHIRKIQGNKSLFEMNYNNWRIDGTPELDLLLGTKYMVHADISNCFPSVYTHSLPWALVGKQNAKTNRNKNWYNDIDKACRGIKNGETHGILIGPHSSNILSEIILVVIDDKLSRKWNYYRNIDDYTCYVKTQEDAKSFVKDLSEELQKYGLSLNHKKTFYEELPISLEEEWISRLSTFPITSPYGSTSYKEVSNFLDLSIKLMKENNMNSAILNYAIKTLSGQKKLTESAKKCCKKRIMHLAVIYPYLIPLIEKYVFIPYKVSIGEMKEFAEEVYYDGLKNGNYEQICYSLYYSIKYSFKLDSLKSNRIFECDNCIYKLLIWMYYKKQDNKEIIDKIEEHSLELVENSEFEQNWLFIYEVLSLTDLKRYSNNKKIKSIERWILMKETGISFIRKEFS